MEEKSAKPNILYVDDEQSNLVMFTAAFRHEYEVFTALNADIGLQILEKNQIEVIVTDQRMPGKTGLDFLLAVLNKHPLPIRIIITAYTDVDTIIKAVNEGKIFSYITKPWNEVEVKHILDNAVKLYRLEKSNRELLIKLQSNSHALRELNETLELKVIERTRELEKSQKELLKTAHLTGMAQVAMGMIHNVSNILNSLNVSASIIAEKIKESQLANLIECNRLIAENKNNLGDFIARDPKGTILLQYIAQIVDSLQKDFSAISKEISGFRKNVQIINEIITTQQSLSTLSHPEKPVDIAGLIEDAVKISGDDFSHNNISITREYASLQPVLINKIKLLQILINLIVNAKQALIAGQQDRKVLLLRITKPHNNFFHIEIIDNGAGIALEDLKNIFKYGFTTKAQGHGYGLHSSGIAAEEMQGKLEIFSEGIGKGTKVVLMLPYDVEAS